MRKWFFAVSLVIILVGIVMASSYSLPRTGSTPEEEAAYVKNAWVITANLKQGDIIRLWITQGTNWRTGLFDMEETDYPGFALLYIWVDVTDPRGNYTKFQMTWAHGPSDTIGELLYLVDINVTTNQGGIDPISNGDNYRNATNSFFSVGGTVMFNGTYTFKVLDPYPTRTEAPASMGVYKHLTATTYPLTLLLPLGIMTAVAGIALAVYSLKSKGKTGLQTKKKQREKALV